MVSCQGNCNKQLQPPFVLVSYLNIDDVPQLSQGDCILAAQGATLLSMLLAAPTRPQCCSGLLQLVIQKVLQQEAQEQQQAAAAAAAAAAAVAAGGPAQSDATVVSTESERRSKARRGIEGLPLGKPKSG
jgi:hypothetical protein